MQILLCAHKNHFLMQGHICSMHLATWPTSIHPAQQDMYLHAYTYLAIKAYDAIHMM